MSADRERGSHETGARTISRSSAAEISSAIFSEAEWSSRDFRLLRELHFVNKFLSRSSGRKAGVHGNSLFQTFYTLLAARARIHSPRPVKPDCDESR